MNNRYEVSGLFPEGPSAYQVEAELDTERRTIWFPLPTGKCVLSLSEELWLPFDSPLSEFIFDWVLNHGTEFTIDYGESTSKEDGYEAVFNVEDAPGDEYKSVHLLIPGELLQDPIANGSKHSAYGFNPWNEEQKAKIVAFLDACLPRLISFFETTANAYREKQNFGYGQWEDGLQTFVPEDPDLFAE